VEFTYEPAQQDGYDYRAIDAWTPGQRAPRPEPTLFPPGVMSILKISPKPPPEPL